MIKAVIDVGTNTFHLLIAEIKDDLMSIQFKKTIAVKLGEGGISNREIVPAAYQRGIKALTLFSKILKEKEITAVKATATAAVRDASNGLQFIEDVLHTTGIKIDIINGQQEAAYIYEGAKASGILSHANSLIMDIGGGSVEFIIANKDQLLWKNSYRIGAARLLADYYNHDPLDKNDINALQDHLNNTLKDLINICQEYQPKQLIGTAGAFDSYKNILALQNKKVKTKQILNSLPEKEFHNLLNTIILSTHQERSAMKGLVPLRRDMILMSSIITKFIINALGINETVACSYALKEGLIQTL